jgi:hypothetical protein
MKKNILKTFNSTNHVPLNLTDELRDIIHGYIMSDGHVTKYGSLYVEQSLKQEKFVLWLYEKLEPLRNKNPITEITHLDIRTNTKTYSKRFRTLSVLKEFRSLWYKPRLNDDGLIVFKKCLPVNISSFFSATFITLWYAGDGYKIPGHRGVKFEVTCFSIEERKILQSLFKEKYNIITSINRAGKSKAGTEQWALNIRACSYDTFHALITEIDLIPRLFPHKLHKNNVNLKNKKHPTSSR